MNISIIGAGYVGLVTGACLAESGMNVLCMDSDADKIERLKKGIMPIFEPGLEELVQKNRLESGRLAFSADIGQAVKHAGIIFTAVNTPAGPGGMPDIRYLNAAVKAIAHNMDDRKVIVNKSTVPIGTGKRMRKEIQSILRQRGLNIHFDIVANPEFMREGSAVNDFLNPERIVIGTESEEALEIIREVYGYQIGRNIPVVFTNIETAEMIKYASNAFLATKVSFINEIANLCELCGADVSVVAKAMGMDGRIGPEFLNPGPGFGGSCFPKDTQALVAMGKSLGYTPKVVKSAVDVNREQKKLMLKKIKKAAGKLENKVITVLGLAFKPQTDDIRESPAISIIEALLGKKAHVRVYDPQAMENVKKVFPESIVRYCSDEYSACEGSECVVLVTEWEQFKGLDLKRLRSIVKKPVLVDLRNVYQPDYAREAGFYYQGVGRG